MSAVDLAPLDPDARERLTRFVVATGSLHKAAAILGVGRETVARAAGGLPVRPGSALLLRQAIAQHAI